MKIVLKTLKGEMINLDINPESTILQLKQLVKKQKGLEIQSQRIVLKGKNTNNNDTLTTLGVKQNDCLIILASYKKAQTGKKQEKEELHKIQQKPVEKQMEMEQEPLIKPEPLNQQNQNKINELISMGFDRQQSVTALQAAFYNTDRAVDYLVNGIPQTKKHPESLLFTQFIHTPQFAQIKAQIKNNPQQLSSILGQIQLTSPQLYSYIVQRPQIFQQAMVEEQNVEQIPIANNATLNQQQQQAIERLISLGFTEMQATEAYLTCDKNQQMAANYLFDREGIEDEEEQDQQGYQGQHHEQREGDDDNLFG